MPTSNSQGPNLPSDPYAFINNSAPLGSKPSPLSPNTTKGRIILIGALAGFLLIAFVILMSFLNNADQAKAKQYLEIGQKQTEIIRLSSIGETKGRLLETRSYAGTIKLTMTSSQNEVNKVISGRGVSTKELSKQLTKSKNTASDKILDEAEKNNRFDETFKELIDSELLKFQQQLNTVFEGSFPNEKKILESAFNQATLLTTAPKQES